ncbi:egg cell-secreted protein 1.2-like [Rutidosis leptorrhynchoides]|uniref:egg cell-secreted protein 1.2-like n=1 Tax=Rutidosis leptorrhynchoides TaxID=125765 RepID=UPI003A996E49
MASIRLLQVTLLLLSCLHTFKVDSTARNVIVNEPANGVVSRVHGDQKDISGLMDCWSALLELKSCSNEIILFFLNGDSYLTMDCCRAIRTITHECWPSMLTSLGFTSEEGDILQDYCGGAPLP